MASRKGSEPAPEERLEADRRNLVYLAAACGEEAGLHRPLNEVVGGVITGIPEEADLASSRAAGVARDAKNESYGSAGGGLDVQSLGTESQNGNSG